MSMDENPFSRLSWKDLTSEEFLDHIISQPEGPFLEFKARLPRLSNTARVIAAYRNSGGGLLIIGVEEPSRVIGIPGDTDLAGHVQAARQLLSEDGGDILLGNTPYRGRYLGVVRIGVFGSDPERPVTLVLTCIIN